MYSNMYCEQLGLLNRADLAGSMKIIYGFKPVVDNGYPRHYCLSNVAGDEPPGM